MESWYSILGVKDFATPEEIRKAYLGKIIQIQPDTSESDDATKVLTQLKRAYDKLKDPKLKKEYDDHLRGNHHVENRSKEWKRRC